MKKKPEYFLESFVRATMTVIYISIVALLPSYGERLFGSGHSFLIPVLILLLFVISATVVGFLVLGKPIQLYVDGLKKEAFTFFFIILGWLILFLFIIFLTLLLTATT